MSRILITEISKAEFIRTCGNEETWGFQLGSSGCLGLYIHGSERIGFGLQATRYSPAEPGFQRGHLHDLGVSFVVTRLFYVISTCP